MMKTCPFCAEPIQDAAMKCRYCGSSLKSSALTREWYRSRDGKKIAGVCVGLAQELGIAALPVRLAFVLLFFIAGGAGLVLYLILWGVMPYRPEHLALPTRDLEAIDLETRREAERLR
jgi:phage shock protein PspC (stress-responsive transcriptional regulator)